MLTRWLPGLVRFMADRIDLLHTKEKYRNHRTGRHLEMSAHLSIAYSQISSAQTSPGSSSRRTGSLLGEEVPWRSLSWWLSDYVWWELRSLHRLHSFLSVVGFQFVFLPFCAHLWDIMDCLGRGFLKKQDAWHCSMYICYLSYKYLNSLDNF